MAAIGTNAAGQVIVQLSLTNETRQDVMVSLRSTIYQTNGVWFTNFSMRPFFAEMAGPGSLASEVTLKAGAGTVTAISPIRIAQPFRVEFVCFPSRSGLSGIVDDAKDKAEELKDGGRHESFLGESFFVASDIIDPAKAVGITTNAASGKGGKP